MSALRVWIDTDVGANVDDAVALLAAAAHPGVELAGVSIVGDDPDRRAAVAGRLLPGDVPVIAGDPPPAVADAIAAARPDVLLAIGPLTNVAALARPGGDRPGIVLMGGTLRPVRHRGALRHVEHNFGSDPPAAAAVLGRVPGVTVVPLDATVATCLDDDQRDALAATGPPAVLGALIDEWLTTAPGVCLHDPAALLVAAGDPVVAGETRARLAVEADGRLVEDPTAGVEHRVVTALDAPAVLRRVLDLLDRGR